MSKIVSLAQMDEIFEAFKDSNRQVWARMNDPEIKVVEADWQLDKYGRVVFALTIQGLLVARG
jgi:hypothetical protein